MGLHVMSDGPAHTIYLNSVQDGLTEELMAAAQNGHVKGVEVLIAAGAEVNFQNEVRFTVMVRWHYTWPVLASISRPSFRFYNG